MGGGVLRHAEMGWRLGEDGLKTVGLGHGTGRAEVYWDKSTQAEAAMRQTGLH